MAKNAQNLRYFGPCENYVLILLTQMCSKLGFSILIHMVLDAVKADTTAVFFFLGKYLIYTQRLS